jgi:hypothetical protein
MNERIKELMIEAGIYECDDFEPHPTFEKFAELIVRECMKLNHEWFSDEDPYTIDSTYRQHFGVEE